MATPPKPAIDHRMSIDRENVLFLHETISNLDPARNGRSGTNFLRPLVGRNVPVIHALTNLSLCVIYYFVDLFFRWARMRVLMMQESAAGFESNCLFFAAAIEFDWIEMSLEISCSYFFFRMNSASSLWLLKWNLSVVNWEIDWKLNKLTYLLNVLKEILLLVMMLNDTCTKLMLFSRIVFNSLKTHIQKI